MQPTLLLPGELGFILVDQARVYGPDASTDTYDVLLLGPFACRLTQRGMAVLGTGIGGVQTRYVHMQYEASVILPPGYWEVEVASVRYTPRANSQGYMRDLPGNTLWHSIDLDQLTQR